MTDEFDAIPEYDFADTDPDSPRTSRAAIALACIVAATFIPLAVWVWRSI